MSISSSLSPSLAIASRVRRLPAAVTRTYGDLRFRIDGQLLALAFGLADTAWSVEDPGVLRQWSLADGSQLSKQILSETDVAWAFGPDARLLASASDELNLWDVNSARNLLSLEQPAWITCLTFRGDGKAIATGGEDGVARVWSITTRAMVAELAEHDSPISAIALSGDGKRLAAAAEDRTICLWETQSARFLGRLVGHSDRIQGLAWHPDGQLLMSCGWDTTTRVWDTSSFETIMLLNGQGDQVTTLAFSPDGRLLATADSNPVIWLWDHAKCRSTHTLRGHAGEIACLAFSPDGKRLLSGGQDRRIIHWDVSTGQSLSASADAHRESGRLDLSADGNTLTYINGSKHVRAWDAVGGEAVIDFEHDHEVLAIATSPDGRYLACGDLRGGIQLRDRLTGRQFRTLDMHKHSVTALAFSPDRRLLASAGGTDGYVYLWSLDTFEPILLIPTATEHCTVESLAFVPGTTLLAAGGLEWLSTRNTEGLVCLWDTETHMKAGSFPIGTSRLAVRHDGEQLAIASALDDTVTLIDLESQASMGELPVHGGAVTGLAYGAGGRLIATGCEDGVLRLWQADSGDLAGELDLDSPIRDLCFSSDGRWLYTAHASAICHRIEAAKLRS